MRWVDRHQVAVSGQGPASRPGPERESFFLVVVGDYSRYTTVFPLAKKSNVTSTLIRWLLTTEGTRGHHVSCLHFDHGGEFRSGVLTGFCREQGIRQSWTLAESPQQYRVAERRIGLAMDIARTSMIHASAPHFLWPYVVRYAAHQLNLLPHVSQPGASPTSLWTGSPGVALRFRVWGCLARVHNTFAYKISPRAIPCVFLGFPKDSSDFTFYHPPLHRFFDSRNVRFDESVPYYTRYPCRGLSVPPPPLFLTPTPPPGPQVVAAETPYSSAKTFEELNLSEPLLRGLYSEMKFERPSKIQAVTLPMILLPPNANLIAQAHNGSGKTTCFVLGMLSRVDPQVKAPQALCICPTRELAQQNEAVLLRMAKYTGITCACTASEGTGTIVSSSQQERLGDQVVIGTPGTLKRWMTKDRILPAKSIKILVFDEADHMLDQDGFQDDSIRMIQFITKSNPTCQVSNPTCQVSNPTCQVSSPTCQRVVPSANQVYVPKEQLSLDVIKQYRVRVLSPHPLPFAPLPSHPLPSTPLPLPRLPLPVLPHFNAQILLFSATFNERVKRFAQRVVPSANQVYVPKEQLSLDVIKQYRVRVPSREAKVVVLKDKIFPAAEKLGQSIIFVKTRETARDLHRKLEADGHRCTSIQGGMSHEERDDVIREFRSGTTKILIATDVLARGFDQAQVTLVVNFDLPVKNAPPNEPEYETYLHRIGRSGRFGRKGASFNLVCGERDERTLNKIEKHFDRVIPDVSEQ
ncbi:unnamed protein product [Closterium sp. NIES-53]